MLDCAIIVVGCNEGLHAFVSRHGADVRGETKYEGESERFRTCHSCLNQILNCLDSNVYFVFETSKVEAFIVGF